MCSSADLARWATTRDSWLRAQRRCRLEAITPHNERFSAFGLMPGQFPNDGGTTLSKPKMPGRPRIRREKFEAAAQEIRDNPIPCQVVYSVSGEALGTVSPQSDGTWSGCRFGPGYPANKIEGASEQAAVAYVADGEELGDGPIPHPAVEAMWKEQELADMEQPEPRRMKAR